MLHPSTKRLIDRLNEMTLQGRIEWAEGDDQAIIYDTEGYRVALVGDPVELRLSDVLGKELEHAAAEDIAATSDDGGVSYSILMSQMQIEARRIARGTEQAISRVLAGLEAPEKTGLVQLDPREGGEDQESDALEEATAEALSEDTEADESDLDEEAASVTAGVAMLAEAVNLPEPELDAVSEPDVVSEAPVLSQEAPPSDPPSNSIVAEAEAPTSFEPFQAPSDAAIAQTADEPAYPDLSSAPRETVEDVSPIDMPPADEVQSEPLSPENIAPEPQSASHFSLSGLATRPPAPQEAPVDPDPLESIVPETPDLAQPAEASPADPGFIVSNLEPEDPVHGAQDLVETSDDSAPEDAQDSAGSGVVSGIVGAIGKAGEKVSETVEAAREIVTENETDEDADASAGSVKPKFNPWV